MNKIISLLVLVSSVVGASPCNNLNLHFFQSEMEPKDKRVLKKIMQTSYGEDVEKYMVELKRANSTLYYQSDKSKPEFTYLSATFKGVPQAQVAYDHLKELWGTSNQHEVYLSNNQVTWFGNVRLSDACFKEWVATEKGKIPQ